MRVAVGRLIRSRSASSLGRQRAVALDRRQGGRLGGAEVGARLLAQAPRGARDRQPQARRELDVGVSVSCLW